MIHRLFARQYNLSINFSYLEVEEHKLNDCLQQFIAQGGSGVNVTAPYKQKIMTQIPHLSHRARVAGAINTISIKDGVISGDNTDGVGFIRDLTLRHAVPINNQKILILGAGGAARGILPGIFELQPQSVTIANRDVAKAQGLAKYFEYLFPTSAVAYRELKNTSFDLIINASSAGLEQLLPPLPSEFNFRDSCCYDLNYLENSRIFGDFAQFKGANKVINGIGMLVEQAAEAFYLWHGLRPLTEPVIAQLQQTTGQISAIYSV